MKKYLQPFRNKFILAGSIFLVYVLFLDDVDVFMVFSKYKKLHELRIEKEAMSQKLSEIDKMQSILTDKAELERYAREENLFKKDNEDIFIISEE